MKIVILKTFPKVSYNKVFVFIFPCSRCNNKSIIAILFLQTEKADISQRHIRFHPNN